MPDKEKLFLTGDRAIEALAHDFAQYPAQLNLLSTLVPMIFGDSAYLMHDPDSRTVWLKTSANKQPLQVSEDRVGEWFVHQLNKLSLSTDTLSRICTLVFQTPVRVDPGRQKGMSPGLWIDTGMDGFTCIQCGRCCRKLDYRNGCSVEDYEGWVESGRTDILRWVGVVKENERIVACRIWMVPGTNRFSESCPWLKRGDRPDRYVCTIHDVRPTICRQYPGTRKHARMTGCRGC